MINKLETSLANQKLDNATAGLEPYFLEHLKTRVSKQNSLVIARYITSMKIETNLSDNHRRGIITSLKLLSEFLNNKPFSDMTREDILDYLDTLRKPDDSDSLHKWISTYNQRLICFLRFFKCLYHSEVEASKREKPLPVANIPTIKRKEKSAYHPSELWTEEDHIIFSDIALTKEIDVIMRWPLTQAVDLMKSSE